jgi:DnaJ-class molecular chaperone
MALCSGCVGQGRIDGTCQACNGSGKKGGSLCVVCSGHGTVKVTCAKCRGTGQAS